MKAPLLEELFKYHDEKNLILSMPGNKCGKGFEKDEMGRIFMERMGRLDITEVDPLDNLHYPEGVIDEAQKLLAQTYNSQKAYFLVNGISGGNLSCIFESFNEGDEIIVERNCHKSIYNAIVLRKLKAVYIEPVIDDELGIFLPPDDKNIYAALEKSSNPKGIILTYPNYFGITFNIKNVINDMKNRGLKIILDSAHGAHFGMSRELPESMTSIADYVVLSAHKTLPALTQGAFVTVNDINDKFEFYLRTFMTTSPSYLIMASLDYSRYYMDSYGKEDYKRLIYMAELWKDKINDIGKVKILSQRDIYIHGDYDIDKTRYLMILPHGYSGHKLLNYLRKKKIQSEMSFSQGVVLILSPFNTEEEFKKIYEAVYDMDLEKLEQKYDLYKNCFEKEIPKKALEPYEAFEAEYETVDIDKCEGRISKEFIIPYPPGIPIICPGEIISKKNLNIIKDYMINEKDVIGIDKENMKVKVISNV